MSPRKVHSEAFFGIAGVDMILVNGHMVSWTVRPVSG